MWLQDIGHRMAHVLRYSTPLYPLEPAPGRNVTIGYTNTMLNCRHSWTFILRPVQPYRLRRTLLKQTRLGSEWYALTPFERWESSTYYGATHLPFIGHVGIEARQLSARRLRVSVHFQRQLPAALRPYVRSTLERWLGVHEDLRDFYRLAHRSTGLRTAVAVFKGMRELRSIDLFETLVHCIALQRAGGGRTIRCMRQLCHAFGRQVAFGRHAIVAFPTASTIASRSVRELRYATSLGFRARFVLQTARALRRHPTDPMLLETLPKELLRQHLRGQYKGLGDYALNILHPAGVPLDSWSVPAIANLMGVPAWSASFDMVARRLTAVAPGLERYAFSYLLNLAVLR